VERLLEQGGLERGGDSLGAATVSDANGVRVVGEFLDDGTADGIADFSDEHFGDGFVLAEDFEGHAGLHAIFAAEAEDSDAEFGLQRDDAGVLKIASGGSFDWSGVANLAEETVSGGESLVEAICSGRIGIRSAAGKVHASLGDFHEGLGKLITLLLDDAEIAQSSEKTLLGLVFGVFEGGDAETFEKATKLFVAIFELGGFLIRCGGGLSEGIVLVLGRGSIRFELLNLLGGHGERGVKFAKLEVHVVLRTHAATHCEKQCDGVTCCGRKRHEEDAEQEVDYLAAFTVTAP
jgi:hypothetical protein